MARVKINVTPIPNVQQGGYKLSGSADFVTLVPGADNGVEFDYNGQDRVYLRNPTGGAAVYTIVMNDPSSVTTEGGTVTPPTVSVATTEIHILKLTDIFKQSDGLAYIDCDVAGEVLVLSGAN